jgi:hypothetical protein
MAIVRCKRCYMTTETDGGTDTWYVCNRCRAIANEKGSSKKRFP